MAKYPVWLMAAQANALLVGFKRQSSSIQARFFLLVPWGLIWVNFALIRNSESFPDEETAATKL